MAQRCGAKHIIKSKCAKHAMFKPLLNVECSFLEGPLIALACLSMFINVYVYVY